MCYIYPSTAMVRHWSSGLNGSLALFLQGVFSVMGNQTLEGCPSMTGKNAHPGLHVIKAM